MGLWHPAEAFQPETLAFLKENETFEWEGRRKAYSCQCTEVSDDRYHLCEFHEGFDSGVAFMKGEESKR